MLSNAELIGWCVWVPIGLATLIFARRVVEGYEGLLRKARPWLSWFAPYDESDGLPLYWPWPRLIRKWGLQVWYFRLFGLMCLIITLLVILDL